MSAFNDLVDSHAAAIQRYVAALNNWRSAYADLAALDRVVAGVGVDAPSFGPPPDPIALRHPVAAPEFGGALSDDIARLFAARSQTFQAALAVERDN